MSRTFNYILIIILIAYTYTSGDSDCEKYIITSNSMRRRVSSLDECSSLKTSDDSIYQCVNGGQGKCIEREKTSDCVIIKATSRRRLSSQLTENSCAGKDTTNNDIFKCELNNDKSQCIEIPISECNYTTSSSNDLTEEICKSKKTSDNAIYKCALKTEKDRCVELIISSCKSTIGRRLSTELSEEICRQLETSDNTIYKCYYDEKAKRCDETFLESECKSKRPSTSSRRLSSELTENDCKNLKTSDDNKYKCVINSSKTKCEEVSKEGSNSLKLSFAILCLLLFI